MYLIPAKTVKREIYDRLRDAQQLVFDALNIGRLGMGRKQDGEIQKEIRTFALKYGLSGLMTALSATPKFMEYKNVCLAKNHFIKEETMPAENYLSLFFPFDKLDIIKHGVESMRDLRNDRTMMAPAMTMSDKPMAVSMCFRREYADRYDWLKQQFILRPGVQKQV